ncbi:MAG TPA: ABC transporter permease [Candidatus Eisenbacteria bacterium]|nr:ABC transporter permease [Candidatus Eisenbacteria bacterium]
MSISWGRIGTVARREFLTTVRRKAFIFTLIGTPAYFAFVMWVSTVGEMGERSKVLEELSTVGVVDSSGLFASAQHEIRTEVSPDQGNMFARKVPEGAMPVQSFTTKIRFFPDQASAESTLRAREISQMVVVSEDYLQSGRLRRYARTSSLFSSADRRTVASWLASGLVRGRVDSLLAARVARPSDREQLFTLDKQGNFELKDDRRELLDFMLPFTFAMLLGVSIVLGGQYLLQGVAEEKESRILESLLCTVSAEELMAGKLFGLGSAGLLVVGIWSAIGAVVLGPVMMLAGVHLPAGLLLIALAYFLLGYLFYGSLMTGIGAITNNMREAQQFAVWFTFLNFAPFIMITFLLGRPGAPAAVALSMFPPTAAGAMMLRLTAPNSVVPFWQLGGSLVLLAAAAWLALMGSARIFRIGLLMYGKTPTLPEIVRWARQR